MFGCYRRGDANDPERYAAAVAAVLSAYPEDIIKFATDPRTGIATRYPKFMPNAGEVRQFCEELYGPRKRMEEWDHRAKKQIAEREALAITDQRPKKTYDELVADCRAKGLMIGPKLPKKHETDINAFLSEHGVSREQFDAIPDAPDYRWK